MIYFTNIDGVCLGFYIAWTLSSQLSRQLMLILKYANTSYLLSIYMNCIVDGYSSFYLFCSIGWWLLKFLFRKSFVHAIYILSFNVASSLVITEYKNTVKKRGGMRLFLLSLNIPFTNGNPQNKDHYLYLQKKGLASIKIRYKSKLRNKSDLYPFFIIIRE